MQKVQVLNVAGSRASKDPEIYADVFKILEQTIQILMNEDQKSGVDFGPDTKREVPYPLNHQTKGGKS